MLLALKELINSITLIRNDASSSKSNVVAGRCVVAKYRTCGIPIKCFSNMAKNMNNVISFISLSGATDVALIAL